MTLAPQDWLLIYLSECENKPVDPIRIMKGMFLHAQESPIPPSESYAFVPYTYGPFTKNIYQDLDNLEHQGLITRNSQGPRWDYRACTATGLQKATLLRNRVSPDALTSIVSIKEKVLSLSFNDLLREVYSKYPEFAVNSTAAIRVQ